MNALPSWRRRSRKLNHWLQQLTGRRLNNKRRRLRAGRHRYQLEILESRHVLATLFGSGTQLFISLTGNEMVTVRSAGSTYELTTNRDFREGIVANSNDFSGFNTNTLTIRESGLARYDHLNFSDDGVLASLVFVDSGTNAYTDSISVTFRNSTFFPIAFEGNSRLTDTFSIEVSTLGDIVVNPNAVLQTDRGAIRFSAYEDIAIGGQVLSNSGPIDLVADSNAFGGGVLVTTPSSVTQQVQLVNPDPSPNDLAGSAVAFSQDGNTAIVGIPDGDVGANQSAGTAIVYVRSAGNWTIQQKLTTTSDNFPTRFGESVSLSADGNTAVIGAPWKTINNVAVKGSVTVFTRSGTTWTQAAELSSFSSVFFGKSVAISGDGQTILVGAYSGAETVPSAATLFRKIGNNWFEEVQLQANGAAPGDSFGASVALSYDGRTAVVGSSTDDVGFNIDQGSVAVFVRGVTWVQQDTLFRRSGNAGDVFGSSVSLSADGNTLVVGSPNADVNNFVDQGSATVFVRHNTFWFMERELFDEQDAYYSLFGTSTSLSADGNRLLVGAPAGSGFVSSYARHGNRWSHAGYLTAPNVAGADFGAAVAISGDGLTAVVGVPRENVTFSSQGSARVYVLGPLNGTVASNDGSVRVTANSVTWDGLLSAPFVYVWPSEIGQPISLGAEVQLFALTEEELDRINTGQLAIGDLASGDIGITRDITRSTPTRMFFATGSDYLGFRGVDTNGGALFIDAMDHVGMTGLINTRGGDVIISADRNTDGIGELTFAGNTGWESINAGAGIFKVTAAAYVDFSFSPITASSVQIQTSQPTKAIEIGGIDSTKLSLSQQEIDQFITPHIIFGSASSGPIFVSSEVTRKAATKLTLIAGNNQDIEFYPSASLNSRGGEIAMNVQGTGSILPGIANFDLIAEGSQISINAAAGTVGQANNPLRFSSARLSTTGTSGNIYLETPGSVDIVAPGWGAGSGTLQISGGAFVGGTIDSRTNLVIAEGSWSVSGSQTVAGFTLVSGQLLGSGKLSSSNTFQLINGSVTAGLGGSGSVVQASGGSTSLRGNNTYTGSTTIYGTLVAQSTSAMAASPVIDVRAGGVLDLTGVTPIFQLANAQTLTGSGSVVGPLRGVAGAHIAPGGNPGTLSTSSIALNGATLDLELNGRRADEYDSLRVFGQVSLGESPLKVVLGYQPQFGDVLKIIDNADVYAVTSQFLGLPEGAFLSVTTGSFTGDFKVSYRGGDGNDVTLSAVAGIGLSIAPTIISEEGGTALGTVRRFNTDVSGPMSIALISSDMTELSVPAEVVIPAGATSVTFPVTAVDDQLLDGLQNVNVLAGATIGSSGFAMQVSDSEHLSISAVSSVHEGEQVTATVTRHNQDITQSLVVSLSVSNAEASVPATVTIPAGQASASFTVTGLRDLKLDGTQVSQIIASHAAYNSGAGQVQVLDAEFFSVSIDSAAISELGGAATGTVTRSNSLDLGSAITISLSSSDTTEATVPSTVTILAGQAAANFVITAVDDNLLDRTQSVTITASHPQYYGAGTGSLNVTDWETLSLTFASSSIAEPNEATTATVTRSNTDNSAPLTVTIVNGDTSEVSVPTTVVIAAGQASATFPVTALVDNLLDGTQTVPLTVTATDYVSASRSINVTDGEFLTLTIDPNSISESGGIATATLRRSNTNTAQALSVNVSSSDDGEASVASTVVIPANAASTTFPITAVDDSQLDGTQIVTIAVTASGYVDGFGTIAITDHETLSITVAANEMNERGGTILGTVARGNSDISQPLTVLLGSSDLSEGTVPASVTIPADQPTVDFVIQAVDDNLLDGTQSLTITATAVGYLSGSSTVSVTDWEELTVTLTDALISENGGKTTVTVTRSDGAQAAPLTVRLASSDTTEATVPLSAVIPSGQASVSFDVTAVDDALLDGVQSVTISAVADGYNPGDSLLRVTDYESLTLTIDEASISESGGLTTGTVRRNNTDTSAALTVILSSNDSSEAIADVNVVIPAGQLEATFGIFAMDDNLLDGTQRVTITAAATGYVTGSSSLDVTDYELLELSFSLDTISELGGTSIATVTRNRSAISQPLTISLSSSDTSEAVVPTTVVIPANQASVTLAITAVDDNLLDGLQTVTISAQADGYVAGSRALAVADAEPLILTIDKSHMSETGGSATGTVSRGNTDPTSALTVDLTSSDSTEAQVPSSVTIAAGATSATFPITAVDDLLLDGPQVVTVSATANGYVPGTATLTVDDAELLTITLSAESISEKGGTATATVTRSNSNIAQPLIVSLSSSDTSELQVQVSVTIPANQPSVTLNVVAVDDSLLDGTQTVTVVATAAGYLSGSKTLSITDSESLSVTFNKAAIKESVETAVGTVTRSNTDTASPLTVQLQSSDTSEATVPATVTIPAGQQSAEFNLTAVDDTLLDGSQTVSITVAATGYQGASGSIEVQDVESLSIELSQTSVSENGGTTQATVTRGNTDTTHPLTVLLAASDGNRLSMPATVVIPAGQASVSFTITASDNALLEGTQTVQISASASGYVGSSQSLSVTDHETLTLTIDPLSIKELGGTAQGRVTRSNTNRDSALEVQLASSDTSEARVPTTITIPAGQAFIDFAIEAIDDDLLDGTQAVNISAAATGYQSATQSFSVTDVEALVLDITLAQIAEKDGTTQGTLRRSNSDNSQSLTVALSSSDTTEATVPATVTIPAGSSSVSFPITAVDDDLLDGSLAVTISASAPGYQDDTADLVVTDVEALTLTLASAEINEAAGTVVGTVRRSNTNRELPLVINLSATNATQINFPASVTIPAGQASVNFNVTAIDDTLLDGSQMVQLTAQAAQYSPASASLNVTDAESLNLQIDLSNIDEVGGRAQVTVTRSNTDIASTLVVSITNDRPGELDVPASVTIAAGQASVRFDVLALDDQLLDGPQLVTLSAQATGYSRGTGTLTVNDIVTLNLVLPVTSVREDGAAISARVSRSNSNLDQPLTVQLRSSDPTEATVPGSVTIPIGAAFVEFDITPVDDTLLDGTQAVSISASSTGYRQSSQLLNVSDVELLTLTLARSEISELNGSVRATVRRHNTDTTLPLQVAVTHSDPSEVSAPSVVTIPAGQSSVEFVINAVDDTLLDGTQSVQLVIGAAGYAESNATLQVTDHEDLRLTVARNSISEKGGSTSVVLRRSNTDTSLPLVVTLSGSDASELTVPASVTIAANQSEVSFTVTAVDEQVVDGSANVIIEAMAAGYSSGTTEVVVTDNDPEFPWQNPRNSMDVNDDGFVTSIDALLVINAINLDMKLPPQLPDPFDPKQYVDVDGNGQVTPLDALLVINQLNMQSGGEGESAGQAVDWEFLHGKRKR